MAAGRKSLVLLGDYANKAFTRTGNGDSKSIEVTY